MKDKKELCKHKHTEIKFKLDIGVVRANIIFSRVCRDCDYVLRTKSKLVEIPEEL